MLYVDESIAARCALVTISEETLLIYPFGALILYT